MFPFYANTITIEEGNTSKLMTSDSFHCGVLKGKDSEKMICHDLARCVFPGVPAVFVAAWAVVRATLADTR